ncbi:MAG: carboxypeptidase regulatory-like domain-containing protein [Planctomycetota bacterium]|nr:carboxypeptidase regulatory-like domain-containing protein [Planctomycetota bacterium]
MQKSEWTEQVGQSLMWSLCRIAGCRLHAFHLTPVIAAVSVVLMVMAGCQRHVPLGKAVGIVTFRGKPVEAGAVIFSNDAEGVAYVGHLGPGGNFRFEVAAGYGLPPGTYQVGIGPPQPKPSLEVDLARKTDVRSPFPEIPKKYFDPATSGFTATVADGENEPFRFEVP